MSRPDICLDAMSPFATLATGVFVQIRAGSAAPFHVSLSLSLLLSHVKIRGSFLRQNPNAPAPDLGPNISIRQFQKTDAHTRMLGIYSYELGAKQRKCQHDPCARITHTQIEKSMLRADPQTFETMAWHTHASGKCSGVPGGARAEEKAAERSGAVVALRSIVFWLSAAQGAECWPRAVQSPRHAIAQSA